MDSRPDDQGPDDQWGVLMAAAQAGDQTAYRQLLQALPPYLRLVLRRHLRGRDEVEDVVQEILLTIHRVRHSYDPARPFKPWLTAIARRRLIDRIRARSRRDRVEVLLAPDDVTFAEQPANSSEETFDSSELRAAIEALPAGQRQAVELLKLQELSLKEAAAVSGLSVAALKVAGHRAYKALRAALSGGRGMNHD